MTWVRFWLVFAWIGSMAGTFGNMPSGGLMSSTVSLLVCAAWCLVDEIDRRLPAALEPKGTAADDDPEFASPFGAGWERGADGLWRRRL